MFGLVLAAYQASFVIHLDKTADPSRIVLPTQ